MKENLLEIVLNWIQRPKVFTSFNSFPLRENFRKPDQTTSQNQAENKIVIFLFTADFVNFCETLL